MVEISDVNGSSKSRISNERSLGLLSGVSEVAGSGKSTISLGGDILIGPAVSPRMEIGFEDIS